MSPASPARPKAAPTHGGPVPMPGLRSWARSTGVSRTGAVEATPLRSTRTSIEAMPRTAGPGAPPQATTESTARSDCTPATSKVRTNSRFVWDGSKTWKSFSASPRKRSTRVSPAGADARPRTMTRPLTVAAAAGSLMFTVPPSGPVVGQVLGMARAGATPATEHRARTAPIRQNRRPRRLPVSPGT